MNDDHRRKPLPQAQDKLLPAHLRSEHYVSAKVRLTLVGESVDPATISDLLGCLPDHGHRKGERTKSMDSSVIPREGVWVKSLACGPDESVNDAILRLLGLMTHDATRWERVCSLYDPFLLVGLDPEGDAGSCALSEEAISELARRGLRMTVGVGWHAEEPGTPLATVGGALRAARRSLGESARQCAFKDAYGRLDGICSLQHYVSFMAEGEWDCALHSLAGIAEVIGAPDECWAALRTAASLMGLSDDEWKRVPGLGTRD